MFSFLLGELQILVWQTSQIIYSHCCRQKVALIACICSVSPLCLSSPLLSFCLSIFFSSRELILSSLFPMSLCWLCDRNHATQVPWQQVECILPLSANLPHLMTQGEWGVWICVSVCVRALNSSDLYLPWVSETELSLLSRCMSSIVSKNEKS